MKKNIMQRRLNSKQIENFNTDHCATRQVEDFLMLTRNLALIKSSIVDVGGGYGYFARELNKKTGLLITIIDSHEPSINAVRDINHASIQAVHGDALSPNISANEGVICFNLILHHLIGSTEKESRALQKKALLAWGKNIKCVFINEYIYESFIGDASGRLIYYITKSKLLSFIGKIVSKVIPSLQANTFGAGVRFRSNSEWIKLFSECGFTIVSSVKGEPEPIALARRFLLIKEVRCDSFLLTY
jgi:hypothetical protein